jgi:hypothetical protein
MEISENPIDMQAAGKFEYEKPAVRTIGSISEVTQASSTNMANNCDCGSFPVAYS